MLLIVTISRMKLLCCILCLKWPNSVLNSAYERVLHLDIHKTCYILFVHILNGTDPRQTFLIAHRYRIVDEASLITTHIVLFTMYGSSQLSIHPWNLQSLLKRSWYTVQKHYVIFPLVVTQETSLIDSDSETTGQ